MKKSLNLILALSLTLAVGLSFFSTGTKASARMMSFSKVSCMDVPPETGPGPDHVRICGEGNDCPWQYVFLPPEATQGECVL